MKNESTWATLLQKALMDKGKIRFFLVFLLLSFVFWFFTKFSKEYTEVVVFQFDWSDLPASIIPLDRQSFEIEVTLNATGFQFLYYKYIDHYLTLSSENAVFEKGTATVPINAQLKYLQDQLFGDNSILNLFPETFFFNYQELANKRIPIVSKPLDLAIGYSQSEIRFSPDSITITGPIDLVDQYQSIEPIFTFTAKINKSISVEVALETLDNQLMVSEQNVWMEVDVKRFSEKTFKLPISWDNLPPGEVVKLFPDKIMVVFAAPLEQLRVIQSTDFELKVDYNEVLAGANKLTVSILKSPDGIKNLRLEPTTIDYLIREQ